MNLDSVRAAAAAVLGLRKGVRYVAIALDDDLVTLAAPALVDSSTSESDYYEERLVNPTMLELARRRGAEGCGGFDFLVVGYGSFHQLVIPSRRGHVSVCLERRTDILGSVDPIRAATAALGTAPAFRPSVSDGELTREPIVAWDDTPDARGEAILAALYGVSEEVRYVALNRGGRLVLSTRMGSLGGTDRSDRYEELLVNPGLLALARARGAIDCGGLRFLVVAYPPFHALVLPLTEGHATVSLPRSADAVALADSFERALAAG